MKKFVLGFITFTAMPFMALGAQLNTLGDVLAVFTQIINGLMPFIVALAVLIFIWGVFQFVMAAGDEEGRKTGRDKMIYGIIGIFVMVSVWGLVNLLQGSFGTNKTVIAPTTNTVPTNPGF